MATTSPLLADFDARPAVPAAMLKRALRHSLTAVCQLENFQTETRHCHVHGACPTRKQT